MTASEPGPRLLRGAPIAAEMREQIAADVADFAARYGRVPALAVVMVGSDAPSAAAAASASRTAWSSSATTAVPTTCAT
jgi:5,10-methylene-tetrahydrofolate dehydrogenase/methenyl tetrahydrofolate cyclohydrolase